MDLAGLYRQMTRARRFELAVEDLWNRGLIGGEMHLATGEEGVAAGVVTHLRDGDGLALTHRCSAALVIRGVPLVPMLREMLGQEDGLCGGRGGHMHLLSKAHMAATSGIVGASLPTGAGFAWANKRAGAGRIAVAFTGDGAMNQGMALETLNLAAAWELPLLVVCIDNGWSITTDTETVTGGKLKARAEAFGLRCTAVDGTDVEQVNEAAGDLIERARKGKGPAFLLATSPRIDGHFLGDPLLRAARDPLRAGRDTIGEVLGGATKGGGGGIVARAGGMAKMMATVSKARRGATRDSKKDPIHRAGKALDKKLPGTRAKIEAAIGAEIDAAVRAALVGIVDSSVVAEVQHA